MNSISSDPNVVRLLLYAPSYGSAYSVLSSAHQLTHSRKEIEKNSSSEAAAMREMKRYHKVGISFVVSAFVITLLGSFFMGEEWRRISRLGMPVVLVACFVFVLALRDRKPPTKIDLRAYGFQPLILNLWILQLPQIKLTVRPTYLSPAATTKRRPISITATRLRCQPIRLHGIPQAELHPFPLLGR